MTEQILATAFESLSRRDYATAERLLRRVIHTQPDHGLALHGLGIVLLQTRRASQALGFFQRAERAGDLSSKLYGNRGNAYAVLGQHRDALASFDQALALAPQDPILLYNRANSLMYLQHYEESLAAFDQALAIAPDFGEAWQNRARVLTGLARPQEALSSFDRALALVPANAELYANRAGTLDFLNRRADALADIDRALALNPNDSLAHWNASFICLALGDYERGFREYEWRFADDNHRWLDPDAVARRPRFTQELWLGQKDIAGKTLFITHEQGFGDAMHFCRYATLAADRGINVILATLKPLERLMQTLRGPASVIAPGNKLPSFDYYIPMLSLPLAFGTSLATIPASIPYLFADSSLVPKFAARLDGHDNRLRVGLAWSGNPKLKNNLVRSTSLADLAPMFTSDRPITFVSVQKEMTDDERAAASRLGIVDCSDLIGDFADTAALMSLLDVVVSVDSAPAHLAGALGLPVWVLLYHGAEWRWLMNRDDSPWYPTARLFRQDVPRDWQPVAGRVGAALAELAAAKGL